MALLSRDHLFVLFVLRDLRSSAAIVLRGRCDDPDIPVPPTGTPVFAPAASCPVGRLDHAGPLRI